MNRRRGLAALAALLVCCGCAAEPAGAVGALFATEDGRMTFTFPAGWTADAESRAFDLVCRDEVRELSAGVFSYTREGAAMPFEPSEALDFHVEDFRARLEDVGEPGKKEERADGAHSFTTVLLTAGDTACYFTLIEFSGYSGRFAVAVMTCPEDAFESERAGFDAIAASAALTEEPPGPAPRGQAA